jgi:hypothetical protein
MTEKASDRTTGTAAGVPFLASPPVARPRASAPVVLAWHLSDPPRSEAAFAAQAAGGARRVAHFLEHARGSAKPAARRR